MTTVWIADEKNGYITTQATDVKQSGNDMTGKLSSGTVVPCWLTNPASQAGLPDLFGLDNLNVPSISQNLKTRFEAKKIYTRISATVLLSINPYQPYDVYSDATLATYLKSEKADLLEPHIFGLAKTALETLAREKDVSIFAFGRSGSGKSESIKQILRLLSANSGELGTKVLAGFNALQFFGNASTVENVNSSRFLNSIVANFDDSASKLTSVVYFPILFQSSRVAAIAEKERNYHILHGLCEVNAKHKAEIKADLKLDGKTHSDFNYLRTTYPERKDDICSIIELLTKIGFKDTERAEIFQILSAVLYLGNVMPFLKTGYKPTPAVENLTALLGLPLADIVENFTVKKTISKGHHVPSDRAAPVFLANRDLLAKHLYHSVFQHVAKRINSNIGDGKTGKGSIYLVDCVGFSETAGHPFEQLCINFAAEKINNFFLRKTVLARQEDYEQEHILWKTIMAPDRSQSFELLEKPPGDSKTLAGAGLFYALPEGRRVNSAPRKLLENFLKDHKYNRFLFVPEIVPKKSPTAEEKRKMELLEVSFGIRHYAGDIVYDTTDFQRKDLEDAADEQMCALLAKSTSATIKLFSKYEPYDPIKAGIGLTYSKQFANLLRHTKESTTFFAPCFLPNAARSPAGLDFPYLCQQVYREGIAEVALLNKKGYHYKFGYDALLKMFEKFLTPAKGDNKDPNYYKTMAVIKQTDGRPRYIKIVDYVEGVLKAFGIKLSDMSLGPKKIFVRYGGNLVLEQIEKAKPDDPAVAPQLKAVLKHILHKRFVRLRGCVRLGNFFRHLLRRRQSAFVLQAVIEASLAWNQRERFANKTKISANTIINFLSWRTHDRPLISFRQMVGKVVQQIRQEKAEEEERQARQNERWKVPPHVLADLALWLGGVIKRPFPPTLIPGLRDGEGFCDLVTTVHPTAKIESIKRGKRQAFFWRENVVKAITALNLQVGCPDYCLFSVDDLLSDIAPNYKPVVYTLQWIARYAYMKFETPLPDYMAVKLESGDIAGENNAAAEEKFWEETPEERKRRQAREQARAAAERKRIEQERFEEEKKKKAEEIKAMMAILQAGATFDMINIDGEREKRFIYLTEHGNLFYTKPEEKDAENQKSLDLNKGVTVKQGKETPLLSKQPIDESLGFSLFGYDDGTGTCLEFAAEDLATKQPFVEALEFLSKWKYSQLSQEEIDKILAKQREQVMSSEERKKAQDEKERREREEAERLAEMLRKLQAHWKEHISLLLKGDKFKQYRGQRVLVRNVAGTAPKKLNLNPEELTFDVLLENIKDFKMTFTSPEDKMDVSALVPFIQMTKTVAGKQEEGIFPAVEEEKVIEDSNCLVVNTKSRPIGLEAPDEKKRDAWTSALNWAVDMIKYDEMKKKFDNEAEAHLGALDPILVKGAWFQKHGLRGVNRRFIRCTPNQIYWLKAEDSELTECVDPILWETVSEVRQGKQTLMFSRSRAAEIADSLCLSIIYRSDKRTLDLVADNEEQAFEWYEALSNYLREVHEEAEKQLVSKLTEKQRLIEEARKELERERQARLEDVGAESSELEKVERALKDKRSELDASAATVEAAVSKVSQERDALIATVEELTKRVQKLTEQLDDSLQQKSHFLEELHGLREEKMQYPKIRHELEREATLNNEQTAQLEEMLQMLKTSILPRWSEIETSVQQDLANHLNFLATSAGLA